jgi:hypothetical protein
VPMQRLILSNSAKFPRKQRPHNIVQHFLNQGRIEYQEHHCDVRLLLDCRCFLRMAEKALFSPQNCPFLVRVFLTFFCPVKMLD